MIKIGIEEGEGEVGKIQWRGQGFGIRIEHSRDTQIIIFPFFFYRNDTSEDYSTNSYIQVIHSCQTKLTNSPSEYEQQIHTKTN